MSLLANLRHRHVISFHGAYHKNGHLCLLLDYAAGGTIEDAVEKQCQRGEDFDTCFVTLWLSQLVAAVLFMHSQGVLHRGDCRSIHTPCKAACSMAVLHFSMLPHCRVSSV